MKVLSIDQSVERSVAASSLNPPGGRQPGVDWVVELRDYDQIFDGLVRNLRISFRYPPDQVGHLLLVVRIHLFNVPYAAVHATWLFAALREEPDLIAPTHGSVRKFNGLGNVLLEVESEAAAPGQRLHLPFEISAKLRVKRIYLPKQIRQPRHDYTGPVLSP